MPHHQKISKLTSQAEGMEKTNSPHPPSLPAKGKGRPDLDWQERHSRGRNWDARNYWDLIRS